MGAHCRQPAAHHARSKKSASGAARQAQTACAPLKRQLGCFCGSRSASRAHPISARSSSNELATFRRNWPSFPAEQPTFRRNGLNASWPAREAGGSIRKRLDLAIKRRQSLKQTSAIAAALLPSTERALLQRKRQIKIGDASQMRRWRGRRRSICANSHKTAPMRAQRQRGGWPRRAPTQNGACAAHARNRLRAARRERSEHRKKRTLSSSAHATKDKRTSSGGICTLSGRTSSFPAERHSIPAEWAKHSGGKRLEFRRNGASARIPSESNTDSGGKSHLFRRKVSISDFGVFEVELVKLERLRMTSFGKK